MVTEAENQCEKVSHAALYARLSYESEKNRERNTIETQMVLLHNFVKEQKDIVLQRNIMIYLKPELILREMVLRR